MREGLRNQSVTALGFPRLAMGGSDAGQSHRAEVGFQVLQALFKPGGGGRLQAGAKAVEPAGGQCVKPELGSFVQCDVFHVAAHVEQEAARMGLVAGLQTAMDLLATVFESRIINP